VPGTSAAEKLTKNFTAYDADSVGKPFAGQTYDATFLIALAIEKAGSTDRTAVRDALRAVASPPGTVIEPGEWAKAKKLIAEGKDINYEGATGPHDFDGQGEVAAVIDQWMVKGGKMVKVGQIQ
jgi:branched-chain amino acid transport system substrate-binding protein